MDRENKTNDGSTDVVMESPVSRGRQSLSPRKRAFRDRSVEVNRQTDESDLPITKRHKLQRSQEEYPAPFTAHADWKLDTGSDGGALLVEEKQVVVGTSDGRVIFCDLDGHVTSQIPLARPIGALMRHDERLYAWCHAKKGYEKWKGALVDLSFDSPMVLFDVEGFGDHCIHADMVDGCLALADNNGNVGLFGCNGVAIWKKEQSILGDGGFLLADESGIYVAHKKVVRRYGLTDGDVTWEYICPGGRQTNISRGYQNNGSIYIESNGTVLQLSKEKGELQREYMPYRHQAAGVCIGNEILVTGNNPTIVFNLDTGKELHRIYIPARLDHSIAKFAGKGHMYVFWDQLYCLNLTDEGLARASDGKYRRTFSHKVPTAPAEVSLPNMGTLTANNTIGGIIVTCSETTDAEVKVTTDADGYDSQWPLMFPRDFCEGGKQFVVEKLISSDLGKFYRVAGKTITKYLSEDSTSNTEKVDSTSEKEDSQDKADSKGGRYLTTLAVSLSNDINTADKPAVEKASDL